jgi:hypothetical protein
VAQDRHELRRRGTIDPRVERASERQRDVGDLEEAGADDLRVDLLALVPRGTYERARPAERRHGGKHVFAIAVSLKRRERRASIGVLRARVIHNHGSIEVAHVEWPEEQPIERTEYGGVDTDADAERQHGDDDESGLFRQTAASVLNVTKARPHHVSPRAVLRSGARRLVSRRHARLRATGAPEVERSIGGGSPIHVSLSLSEIAQQLPGDVFQAARRIIAPPGHSTRISERVPTSQSHANQPKPIRSVGGDRADCAV